jgi:putative phage-type endonuclease
MNDFIEQGSPAWLKSRLGKVTASRMADLLDKTQKGVDGAKRTGYRRELVYERLTNRAIDRFVTREMQWGIDHEAEAKQVYSLITGNEVRPAPFVLHPTIAKSGASPDGFIDQDGLVECKCPASVTHIATMLADEIPEQYLPQMFWQIECSKRDYCDFLSYDPRLPANMQIWIKRLYRDETAIEKLRENVTTFLASVDETIDSLLKRYPS